MTWRFAFGLGDAGQGGEEELAGVFDEEGAGAEGGEVAAHEFGFAFAHHAGIDVGAVNALRPQRAEAQRVGDRGIDAAADEEKDVAAGGGLADVLFEGAQLARRVPILRAAADVEQEIRQDGFAAGRVGDLRVKLDPIQSPRSGTHGGHRTRGRSGEDIEAVRRLGHQIAVAHPDLLASGDAAKNGIRASQIELCESVFAFVALLHRPVQKVCHKLLSVANTQNRDARRAADGSMVGLPGS